MPSPYLTKYTNINSITRIQWNKTQYYHICKSMHHIQIWIIDYYRTQIIIFINLLLWFYVVLSGFLVIWKSYFFALYDLKKWWKYIYQYLFLNRDDKICLYYFLLRSLRKLVPVFKLLLKYNYCLSFIWYLK